MSRGQTYVFQFGTPVPVHRIFWFTRTGAPNELALKYKEMNKNKRITNKKIQVSLLRGVSQSVCLCVSINSDWVMQARSAYVPFRTSSTF